MGKTDYVTLKLPVETKQALREIAQDEHRSLSNMILVIVDDWLIERKNGQPESQPAEATA